MLTSEILHYKSKHKRVRCRTNEAGIMIMCNKQPFNPLLLKCFFHEVMFLNNCDGPMRCE